jgi:hypothetical protein
MLLMPQMCQQMSGTAQSGEVDRDLSRTLKGLCEICVMDGYKKGGIVWIA